MVAQVSTFILMCNEQKDEEGRDPSLILARRFFHSAAHEMESL